jgi:hypothetical protein
MREREKFYRQSRRDCSMSKEAKRKLTIEPVYQEKKSKKDKKAKKHKDKS